MRLYRKASGSQKTSDHARLALGVGSVLVAVSFGVVVRASGAEPPTKESPVSRPPAAQSPQSQPMRLSDYPKAKRLEDFEAYPQRSGNTCGPVAVRHVLKYLTGTLHDEQELMRYVVAADHKHLAHLADDLRAIGVPDPRMLSVYGTTPAGNTRALNKHLAPKGLKAEFRSIRSWDERLLLIVESINRGRPVVAPLVSASLHHWTVIIGYDLEKETLLGVNSLVGVPSRQPHGGTYFTVPFRDFDRANSFEPLPPGLLGRVFALASKKDLGRWVLVYIVPRDTEKTTGERRRGPD